MHEKRRKVEILACEPVRRVVQKIFLINACIDATKMPCIRDMIMHFFGLIASKMKEKLNGTICDRTSTTTTTTIIPV